MTPSLRTFGPRWIAGLWLAAAACNTAEPVGPEPEFREGQTATFKTENTDLSFKWKGCEPPWGPDPYRPGAEPPRDWTDRLEARLLPDLGAHALDAWLGVGGGSACDEGCASLDLAWTGDAQALEPLVRMRDLRALGHCTVDSLAWSVEFAGTTAVACACG